MSLSCSSSLAVQFFERAPSRPFQPGRQRLNHTNHRRSIEIPILGCTSASRGNEANDGKTVTSVSSQSHKMISFTAQKRNVQNEVEARGIANSPHLVVSRPCPSLHCGACLQRAMWACCRCEATKRHQICLPVRFLLLKTRPGRYSLTDSFWSYGRATLTNM